MFPTGLPGLALLFLRASVAFAVVVETYLHGNVTAGWFKAVVALVAAALSAGYLTPIAAAMAIAVVNSATRKELANPCASWAAAANTPV